MTLIYGALLCEVQVFCEYYKLKKVSSTPKIYANDSILVLVGGIGEQKVKESLSFVFQNYSISKLINVGIAGCSNKEISIGSLFCTNKNLEDISYMILITSKSVVSMNDNIEKNTLYDMEAKYILENKYHLKEEDIFIFKIVSDYLEEEIKPKEFIKSLVFKNKDLIVKYI